MAKRASQFSVENPISISNKTMVLRARPAKNSKRETWDDEEEEEYEIEAIPSSRKRSKSTLKRKKIDANKPKKPPTAFFYFLEDFRKGYQQENPEVKKMSDIGKICGEKWKTMTYEEKVKYYDIATEKRAEFDTAMAEYIRKKESGEDAEFEDSESEFYGE